MNGGLSRYRIEVRQGRLLSQLMNDDAEKRDTSPRKNVFVKAFL